MRRPQTTGYIFRAIPYKLLAIHTPLGLLQTLPLMQKLQGLTTSITPSSSVVKVLVQINVTYSAYGHGGFKVYRSQGGTDTLLSVGDANTTNTNQVREVIHFYRTTGNSSSYDMDSASVTILDTPSTSSAVSYKLICGSSAL